MIVVIGELICDVYVEGQVHRISPDAPVPVLLRTGVERRASGACLSVCAAVKHGAQEATIIGVVGSDETANFLRQSMRQSGVEPLLGAVPGCTSITKTRFRTGNQHLLRVDDDGTFDEHLTFVGNYIVAAWEQVRKSTSLVLLSDYHKGSLSSESIRHIVAECKANDIKVVVDTKRPDLACFTGASVWMPNTLELVASGHADNKAGLRDACDQLDLEAIIVTRAERGVTVALRSGDQQDILAPNMNEVRSVAGAGDVLAGAVAALTVQGADWVEAATAGVHIATEFVTLDPVCTPYTAYGAV